MTNQEAIRILDEQRNKFMDEWVDFGGVNEAYNMAIAMLKEQNEQKRKWLQTIADTQLAISPTGYESEDEIAKRGWEWNGLQMAWEIIAGEERSEHPRLVRCKDCKHGKNRKDAKGEDMIDCLLADNWLKHPDWFCADGVKRE